MSFIRFSGSLRGVLVLAAAAVLLASCNGTTPAAPATPGQLPPEHVGLNTCAALFPSGVQAGQAVPQKFVCIDAPDPGASIDAAAGQEVTLRGWVAGAFEQNVLLELRDADGNVVAEGFTTAFGADVGLFAAQWEGTLTVQRAPAGDSGELAAFTSDAQDGGVDVEAAIPVRFAR
jgi:hypothetical protein